MTKAFLVLIVAGLLTGCGGPTEGTIIGTRHEDARYYEEYDYCKTQYPVTRTRIKPDGSTEIYTDTECMGGMVTRYDDEDWLIRIEKCDTPKSVNTPEAYNEGSDPKKESKPKCKRGWREIDSELFKLAKVGSYYDGDTITG